MRDYITALFKTRTYTANVIAIALIVTLCFGYSVALFFALMGRNVKAFDLVVTQTSIFKDVIMLVIGAVIGRNSFKGDDK
jgi:site-specific recombinase